MIVLGIDPGTAIVGYGVLAAGGEKPRVIDFGCITTLSSAPAGERLDTIHKETLQLIKQHRPDLVSVESLYFFKNAKTAMPVSQARGVILLAAQQQGIPIVEFTPLQVKMTVVGYGKADKKQVQAMTKQLLDLSSFDQKQKARKKDDAADALGVALCAVLKGSSPL